MSTKYNNEDLLYSLPDYITGKLSDEDLKNKIANEIEINTGFREEYELLKETYSSIKNLEFSEPPAHYFTNLVPLINQRIESESKFSFAHIFRITNLLKYALPAVSVVLLIVVFTFTNKSNKEENMFVQTDNTITNIMKETVDSTTVNKEAVEEASTEKVAENNTEVSVQVVREKNTKQTVKTVKEANVNTSNILELFTENEEPEAEEVFMYESEFTNLSKNEQSDLLSKLSKTKF